MCSVLLCFPYLLKFLVKFPPCAIYFDNYTETLQIPQTSLFSLIIFYLIITLYNKSSHMILLNKYCTLKYVKYSMN